MNEYFKEEFGKYGYKIKMREVGYCPLKIASWFESDIKFFLPFIGEEVYGDNTVSKEVLGLEYRTDLR